MQDTPVRSARAEVSEQNPGQHKDTTQESVDQEIPGRIDTTGHMMIFGLTATDTNQQEHRSQLDFPEEEEEEEVQRDKDTHDARFQEQQQSQVFFNPRFLPATDHCQQSQQAVQHNHWQAQTINTQVVVNIEMQGASRKLNPGHLYTIPHIAQATKAFVIAQD